MQRKRAQGFACRRTHRVVGEPSPNMQTSRLNSTKPRRMNITKLLRTWKAILELAYGAQQSDCKCTIYFPNR